MHLSHPPSSLFVVHSSIKPPLSMNRLFMVTGAIMVKLDLFRAHHRPFSHLCGECSRKDRSPDRPIVKPKKTPISSSLEILLCVP